MAPSDVSPQVGGPNDHESQRANGRDWDRHADDYQAEHGAFLRDAGFVWSPEGADEAELKLLGDVAGRDVLEVGCGAAQCSRWLLGRGARPVGLDLSRRQLQHARRIDDEHGTRVPVVQASATALPFADGSFDAACSAFGALPFLRDADAVMREVARVLRPGSPWVFSVTHPVRWMFPDDPTTSGAHVVRSYFDAEPYVERDDAGALTYVEWHRTVGAWVHTVLAGGLVLEGLLEPEWREGNEHVWGGWGPERGRLVPGTLIVRARLP